MEEGQPLDEFKYNPSTEYAMYWGIVLERLAAELSEIFAHVKEPVTTYEGDNYNLGVGHIRIVPDQFLPSFAKPEMHKISNVEVIILMGMDCWRAFQPSGMAFCYHLGQPLIELLRVPLNRLHVGNFTETISSLTIELRWDPIVLGKRRPFERFVPIPIPYDEAFDQAARQVMDRLNVPDEPV